MTANKARKGGLTPRAKMNENEIGKEVVEVAVKLGLALNFGSSLMKQGMQRVINGLAEENLGVVAALRETQIEAEPDTE